MNQWDQRIREHRVWTEMRNLGPAIDKAAAVNDLPPEVLLGLERLRTVLAYCGKRIAAADPLITAPATLDTIAPVLAAVSNELVAFVGDKDPAHIVNANVGVDGALGAISQVPGDYSPEELGALVAASAAYRTIVSEALAEAQGKLGEFRATSAVGFKELEAKLVENSDGLAAKAAEIQGRLDVITANIEAERQRLATIVTEQQGQFSTSQDARSKEFTESVRLANEGFTKLVTDYQSQFSAAQDARSKEHTAAESARQTKYTEAISDFGKRLTEQDAEFTKQRTTFVATAAQELAALTSDYKEKGAKVLEDIEDKRKHVEKLVGVIGNLGVTSGYVRAANQARWGMWGWQGATLASLITLSWLAYRTLGLLEDHGGHFNWGGFAGRALLLVSLGVIAAYSGNQADKLFVDERRNRKLALELEAIGPYLAPLPLEEQNKFRLQIGDRSFGRDADAHEHRKSPASVLDLFKSKEAKELLAVLLEAASKARDVK
jgi:hypothetical protein